MKKSCFISLFVSIIALSMFAEIKIGAIGGFNFADLDPYVDGRSKKAEALTKFCGGILLDVDISEYFILRLEPMYIPKGGNILDALRDIENIEMEVNCSYLEFPVFFKTNHENPLHLYLLCGPVFSYLLECETELELDANIFNPQLSGTAAYTADLMDVTKRFDLGLGIGCGFKISLRNYDIFAEMRYVRGLTNARESGTMTLKTDYDGLENIDIDLLEENNKYANQGLQLLLGVSIPLF